MRIILVTGLGGAGRTTVAAATALAEARAGRRVLLVSEDAEGLPDGGGLRVLRPEPAADFRREFLALQARSGVALDLLGAAPFEDAELTELPGSRPFALLRAPARGRRRRPRARRRRPAPAPRGPRRPRAPRAAPPLPAPAPAPERQAARALRPMLAQLAGVPMPAQWLYETTARWGGRTRRRPGRRRGPRHHRPARPRTRARRRPRPAHRPPRPRPPPPPPRRRRRQPAPSRRLRGPLARRTDRRAAPAPGGAPYRRRRAPRAPAPRPRPARADDLALLAPAPAAAARPPARLDRRGPARGGRRAGLAPPAARRRQGGALLVRRGDELLLTAGPFRRNLPSPAPCAAAPSPAPASSTATSASASPPTPGSGPVPLTSVYRRSTSRLRSAP